MHTKQNHRLLNMLKFLRTTRCPPAARINRRRIGRQARFHKFHAAAQARYTNLQAEYDNLEAIHVSLCESYQALQVDFQTSRAAERRDRIEMEALRRELEEQLLETLHAVAQMGVDAEQRMSELQQAEQRLVELQKSHIVRLAQSYYAFYSRPVLGLPLRLLRRIVANLLRC